MRIWNIVSLFMDKWHITLSYDEIYSFINFFTSIMHQFMFIDTFPVSITWISEFSSWNTVARYTVAIFLDVWPWQLHRRWISGLRFRPDAHPLPATTKPSSFARYSPSTQSDVSCWVQVPEFFNLSGFNKGTRGRKGALWRLRKGHFGNQAKVAAGAGGRVVPALEHGRGVRATAPVLRRPGRNRLRHRHGAHAGKDQSRVQGLEPAQDLRRRWWWLIGLLENFNLH